MSGPSVNVQDGLLLQWLKRGVPVQLSMTSGDSIVGKIARFDRFAIVVEAGDREVLVYKHAIATLEVSEES